MSLPSRRSVSLPVSLPASLSVALAGIAGLGAHLASSDLSTEYRTDRVLAVEATLVLGLETVQQSMTVNGEPVEGRGGGGGGSSEETRRIAFQDRVLEVGGGQPVQVRRSFETVDGEGSIEAGEREVEMTVESPFGGLVLELIDEDGEVQVEVVEGDEPDAAALQGHRLALSADALLPSDEVEVGDSWSLSSEQVANALLLDLQPRLFPRPEREPRAEGEGRGGGGGRGRGGAGRGGASAFGLLANADFEGEVEVLALDEEGDDGPVARLRIEASAAGEVEPREGAEERGGRGGGGGAGETTYEIELEGELVFSLATRRPVSLTMEGTVERSTDRSFSRGDREMEILREEAGTFSLELEISEGSVEDEE